MGHDDRYGAEGWRERSHNRNESGGDRNRDYREGGREGARGGGSSWNDGRREATGWGPSGGRDEHRGSGHDGGEDRGFFERASETARSWFGGGDHGEDGRGGPDRGSSHRDNGYGDRGAGTLGGGGFGGGWGNQEAESWHRDRPGRDGWFTDSVGGERGQRQGGSAGGYSPEQGRGGDHRHQQGGGFQPQQQQQSRGGGYTPMTGDYGRGGLHDPHYSQWRQRQIEEIDRDYEEYRREHQSKFESEFGNWRSKRQGQRQSMGRVTEQMEVLGSDGTHLGTVDKVRGDRIILTKSDPNAGGVHHSVPCSWVENVDEKVTLNRTAEQAMTEWRDEDRNRALFEKPDQGSEGPHVLNRSFSGTYSDRADRDD